MDLTYFSNPCYLILALIRIGWRVCSQVITKNGHRVMLIITIMLKKCIPNIQRGIELGSDSSPHSPLSPAHSEYFTAFLLLTYADIVCSYILTFLLLPTVDLSWPWISECQYLSWTYTQVDIESRRIWCLIKAKPLLHSLLQWIEFVSAATADNKGRIAKQVMAQNQ